MSMTLQGFNEIITIKITVIIIIIIIIITIIIIIQRIRSKGVKHLGRLDLLKASHRGMPCALVFLRYV